MADHTEDYAADLLDLLSQHVENGDVAGCVSTCREILDRLDPSEHPDACGTFHGQLAHFIAQDVSNPNRVPDAIQHHQLALRYLDEQESASQTAASSGTLANLFLDLAEGDRNANLTSAIEYFHEALFYFDQHSKGSSDWAATHASLADAYMELGDHEDDVMTHAEAALTALSPGSGRWAQINLALSEVYSKRVPPETDKAIPYLEQALTAFPRERHFEYGYLNERLGHWYAESQTLTAENAYRGAFDSFTAALEAYEAGESQDGVHRVHAQIGALLATSPIGERSANVREAEGHLEAVILNTDPADPEWGVVNAALVQLRRSDGSGDEESTIEDLRNALSSEHLTPDARASLHEQLGLAYADRRAGFRDENIEQAISHLTRALELEADPGERARDHHNLSMAFRNRIRGRKAENLDKSIHHVRAALEGRTPTSTPLEWSDSMRSLGESQVALASSNANTGAGLRHLRAALDSLGKSLTVLDITEQPLRYGQINLTLAGLLATAAPIVTDDERRDGLERCTAAQEVFTRDEHRVEWAQCERFRRMLLGNDDLSQRWAERLVAEMRDHIHDADDPFASLPDQIIDFVTDSDQSSNPESEQDAMTEMIEYVAEKLRGLLVNKEPELVGEGLLTIHLVPDWDLQAQSLSKPPYHISISENLVRFCMVTSELLALGLGFQAVDDEREKEGPPASAVLSHTEVSARFSDLLTAYRNKKVITPIDVTRGPAHFIFSRLIFFTTLAFLISHEISHVIIAQCHRRSTPPPFGDYVDGLLGAAFESIMSGQHHQYLKDRLEAEDAIDRETIYDNWREEINADVIAASLTSEYQREVGPWSQVPDVAATTNLGIHLALISQMILMAYRNQVWDEDVVLTATHPPMDFRTFCVLQWIYGDNMEAAERPVAGYASEILDDLLRKAVVPTR